MVGGSSRITRGFGAGVGAPDAGGAVVVTADASATVFADRSDCVGIGSAFDVATGAGSATVLGGADTAAGDDAVDVGFDAVDVDVDAGAVDVLDVDVDAVGVDVLDADAVGFDADPVGFDADAVGLDVDPAGFDVDAVGFDVDADADVVAGFDTAEVLAVDAVGFGVDAGVGCVATGGLVVAGLGVTGAGAPASPSGSSRLVANHTRSSRAVASDGATTGVSCRTPRRSRTTNTQPPLPRVSCAPGPVSVADRSKPAIRAIVAQSAGSSPGGNTSGTPAAARATQTSTTHW